MEIIYKVTSSVLASTRQFWGTDESDTLNSGGGEATFQKMQGDKCKGKTWNVALTRDACCSVIQGLIHHPCMLFRLARIVWRGESK